MQTVLEKVHKWYQFGSYLGGQTGYFQKILVVFVINSNLKNDFRISFLFLLVKTF